MWSEKEVPKPGSARTAARCSAEAGEECGMRAKSIETSAAVAIGMWSLAEIGALLNESYTKGKSYETLQPTSLVLPRPYKVASQPCQDSENEKGRTG
jgi:hypothetical protein